MVLGLFVGPDDDALISKNTTNSQGHGQRAPGMIRRVVVAAVDDYGIITFHVFGKHHQLTPGQLLKSPSQSQIARITGRILSFVRHGASSFQSLLPSGQPTMPIINIAMMLPTTLSMMLTIPVATYGAVLLSLSIHPLEIPSGSGRRVCTVQIPSV